MSKYQQIETSEVIEELKRMKTNDAKIEFLQQEYPCIALFVMKKMGMENALADYSQKCESLESIGEKYSHYVHGYFIPWLQQQREAGLLKKGKSIS